jgi:succinate dehydrogenase/fumarate reductase flavoprotein subunit
MIQKSLFGQAPFKRRARMNWDEETGVLIIGFGGAGATAAITAHDFGARVLIVEKLGQGGGNTNLSLGGFLSITDIEEGLLYLESLCNSISKTVDPDILRVYATQCHKNKEWIESFGVSTHVYGGASFPQLPGADAIEKRIITGGNTPEDNSFWSFLKQQVEKRRIKLWNNSKAKKLITDTEGAVTGAIIKKGEKELAVKAKKAVIMRWFRIR